MKSRLREVSRALLFAAAAFAAIACANTDKKRAMAKDAAMREMGCQSLETADEETLLMRGRFRMTGCGQEQTYVVQCRLFGCQTLTEAEWTARQQAPAPTAAAAPGAAPPPESAPAGATAAPASTHVSVTLVNECPQTVPLFFGDKPKFGSGRSSTIGANTRTSHSGSAGDMIWITDASGNGIGSVTLDPAMREVRITSSCSGFATS